MSHPLKQLAPWADLQGSEELKQVLAAEGAVTTCIGERAGNDAASSRTTQKAMGMLVLQRRQVLDHQRRPSRPGTMAVTDPDRGASGISAFMVHKDDEGL